MSTRGTGIATRALRVEELVRRRTRDEAAAANAAASAALEGAEVDVRRVREELERAEANAASHTPSALRLDHRHAGMHRVERAGLSDCVDRATAALREAMSVRRAARRAARSASDALLASERELRSIERAIERAGQRMAAERLRAQDAAADDEPHRSQLGGGPKG